MKKLWIPFVFFALSFYSLGADIMDGFVIYHSWLYVGDKEFATMHQATSERIQLFLVLPMLILTVFCVLMFWHHPAGVSKKLVWIAFTALLAGWFSSAFIQIPIQMQLSQGKNDVLLHKLIITDWIRITALLIYIGIVVKMILRIKLVYAEKKFVKQKLAETDA